MPSRSIPGVKPSASPLRSSPASRLAFSASLSSASKRLARACGSKLVWHQGASAKFAQGESARGTGVPVSPSSVDPAAGVEELLPQANNALQSRAVAMALYIVQGFRGRKTGDLNQRLLRFSEAADKSPLRHCYTPPSLLSWLDLAVRPRSNSAAQLGCAILFICTRRLLCLFLARPFLRLCPCWHLPATP